MDIQLTELKNASGFLKTFFPGLHLKKGAFGKDNSVRPVLFLTYIVDALVKSENLRKRQNLELQPEYDYFTQDPVKILRNISFYFHRFETNIFKFTRTERQSFLFVMENIQEFLKSEGFGDEKKSDSGGFLDYKFWIENYFKIFDQKINGKILNSDTGIESGKVVTFPDGTIDSSTIMFSTQSTVFSLSPFVIKGAGGIFFLTGAQDGNLKYVNILKKTELFISGGKTAEEFSVFRFANFDFRENKSDLIGRESSANRNFDKVRSAYELHGMGFYDKSIEVLSSVISSLKDYPLTLLLQIKNISRKNDRVLLRNLLEEFSTLYPNYFQGFELLGMLNEKEEDYKVAIENYEKSVKLKQNKEIVNKIKQLKSKMERETANKNRIPLSTPFISITRKVFESPERIIAREKEISEIMEILISDSRNNLLLVGDSGVGKSALIRLLAKKVMEKDAHKMLKGRKLMEINFVSLITGTKFRGQFEEKLVKLLNEFRVGNDILVLEDVHLMMSPGSARGTSMDLVNILKQYIRDNDIQVIATTNYEEYKNTVERDNSFLAYFQRVFVKRLPEESVLDILKYEKDKILKSDGINFSDELIERIVENGKGDIMGKKLPDSALLIFERMVAKARLRSVSTKSGNTLTGKDLSEVMSDILNLPFSDVSVTLMEKLELLESRINRNIIGQEDAVKKLVSGIIVSKLGYDVKENRPDGVFLFVGPTGVGKSETALVLSKLLYGSGENLIRIDMSEYMERFTYSRFVGAAPGYVGYNDSTQLTDKVRQNPYSVILLDEIEKADYQLLNIFLQVFDAGRMTDARGNVIDFSHTTIIMTSNIGTDLFTKTIPGYRQKDVDDDSTHNALKNALKKFFSPEFLNRIDEIVTFRHLDKKDVKKIIGIQLEGTVEKLLKQGKILKVSNELKDYIVSEGYSKEYGARNISRTIKNLLLEKIAYLSMEQGWEDGNTVNCFMKNGKIEVEVVDEIGNRIERVTPAVYSGIVEKEKMKNG